MTNFDWSAAAANQADGSASGIRPGAAPSPEYRRIDERVAALEALIAEGSTNDSDHLRQLNGAILTLTSARDQLIDTDLTTARRAHDGLRAAHEGVIDVLEAQVEARPGSTVARARVLGALTRYLHELNHPIAPDPATAHTVAERHRALWPSRPAPDAGGIGLG